MRKYLFEVLSTVMLLGSLVFFWECVAYLGRRDYVASLLLFGIGLSVIHVGVELARLALAERT